MKALMSEVERWRARGERVAIATVVATRKSAPRPLGSKLAISEDGEVAGSVSGGCVEADVCAAVGRVLAEGRPTLLSYGIADEDAFGIGLPCGGEIEVFVEELGSYERLRRALEREEHGVVCTVLEGAAAGQKLLVLSTGETAGSGHPELRARAEEFLALNQCGTLRLADGSRAFIEVLAPPPRLLVYGADDIAEALCALAKVLGWRTIVADARASFATRARVPSADEILVAWPREAVAAVRPDRWTAVVVLAHEHKFDLPLLRAALETDAGYIGAVGSRTYQEQRRSRLVDDGMATEELERVSGPCGLDLGSASPSETALSILAEIVAARNGRGGGRLREVSGRIHPGLEPLMPHRRPLATTMPATSASAAQEEPKPHEIRTVG